MACHSILPDTGDPESRHAYHLYTPLLQLEKLSVRRQHIVAAMEAENIGVGIHYEPVHTQPYYRERLGYRDGGFAERKLRGRAHHLAAPERRNDRGRCSGRVRRPGAYPALLLGLAWHSIHTGVWPPVQATT